MKSITVEILKKIYNKIFNKRIKTKEELFLYICRKFGISIPSSLDLSYRNVLVPHHMTVQQFAQHLEVGERVLDMGCGLGILSKIALKKGAKEVVAVDINPAAVKEACKLLPGSKIILSNLFENVAGVYDTIIFNAPWVDGEINKPLDYAIYDCDGVVERFFNNVRKYVTEGGHIWLQYSDAFPHKYNRLNELFKENNFKVRECWHHKRWGPLVNRRIKVFLYKISIEGRQERIDTL